MMFWGGGRGGGGGSDLCKKEKNTSLTITSHSQRNYYIFCNDCLTWQVVSSMKKMMDSCNSNKQSITGCHIK